MAHKSLAALLVLMLSVVNGHSSSDCTTVVVTGAAVHSGTYEYDSSETDGEIFVMESENQTSYIEREDVLWRHRRHLAEAGQEGGSAREDDPRGEPGVPVAVAEAAAILASNSSCPNWYIRGYDGNGVFIAPIYYANDCHKHPVDITEEWLGVECLDCDPTAVNIAIECEDASTTSEAAGSRCSSGVSLSLTAGALAILTGVAIAHVVSILA